MKPSFRPNPTIDPATHLQAEARRRLFRLVPTRFSHRILPGCPTCQSGSVSTIAVETSGGKLLLVLRCASCRHEWHVPDPGPAPRGPESR